jgi:predicted metal-binding protein
MKCEFCQKDIKNELLSKVRIEQNERVMICKSCEADLKEKQMESVY